MRAILSDPDYVRLKGLLLEHTGLHYYADKDEDLAARLGRRMALRDVHDCGAYLRLLEGDREGASERNALIGELTIGETYFFRQKEHFDLLRTAILPDLLARRAQTRRIRIWSAGCATGAEAYSITLLLRREWHEAVLGWDVSVLATDINTDFLAQARTGRFAEWALRDLPSSLKKGCFQQEGRWWVLNREYREHVTFEYHNLASSDPYPGELGAPLDLIFCRNVMIYFSRERIRALAERFYHSLNSGGWLLVGHAEASTDAFAQFELVVTNSVTAYRRPLEDGAAAVSPIAWQPWIAVAEPVPTRQGAARTVPAAGESELERPAETATVEQARALADAGQWKAAAGICHRLIGSDSLNAAAHFTLGLVLEHSESSEEAQAAFRRAIYIERDFALAHYHLGLALQAGAKGALARKSFGNVMQLLGSVGDDDLVPYGDGVRAGELRELAAMHLESAEEP